MTKVEGTPFILVVGGVALARGKPVVGFLADAFCVSNYFHCNIAGGWSLSTEELFYILFPVLLYLGSRVMPHRKLIALPITWLVALPVLRWLIIRNVSLKEVPHLTYLPFHTHSDGLAAGLIIAWIAVMRPDLLKNKFSSSVWVLIGGVAGALLLRHLDQPVFSRSASCPG